MKRRGRSCGCGGVVMLLVIIVLGVVTYIRAYRAPDVTSSMLEACPSLEDVDRANDDALICDGAATVVVAPDDNVAEIASTLQAQQLIRSAWAFEWWIRAQGKIADIQPGVYRVPVGMNLRAVAQHVLRGPQRAEVQVTLLEGWTNAEMAQALAQAFVEEAQQQRLTTVLGQPSLMTQVQAQELFMTAMDDIEAYRGEYVFLEEVPAGRTTEGYLFPDTYRFFLHETPQEVVREMLTTFQQKIFVPLSEEAQRVEPLFFDTIRLASIVEGESGRLEDHAAVAGVFRNRLAIGMKLESDATVNYVTGASNPRPTFRELAEDSLYNTYRYTGLPYGPIGNPGKDAIEAAIFYEDHDYLFFIANLQTGETIYGGIAAEHQASIGQYVD